MAAKKLTKTELYGKLAEETDLTKAKIGEVFGALEELIKSELKRAGKIEAIPGLVEIKKVDKPARPAREGRNPRTGETIMIPAKKATKVVKTTIRKKLKEMVLP